VCFIVVRPNGRVRLRSYPAAARAMSDPDAAGPSHERAGVWRHKTRHGRLRVADKPKGPTWRLAEPSGALFLRAGHNLRITERCASNKPWQITNACAMSAASCGTPRQSCSIWAHNRSCVQLDRPARCGKFPSPPRTTDPGSLSLERSFPRENTASRGG